LEGLLCLFLEACVLLHGLKRRGKAKYEATTLSSRVLLAVSPEHVAVTSTLLPAAAAPGTLRSGRPKSAGVCWSAGVWCVEAAKAVVSVTIVIDFVSQV